MPWKKKQPLTPGNEQGFTLIEILATIVILSVVSLALTSYFTHALSYSKANQSKTIMVNLARNALFYVEKQDFDAWKNYFVTDQQESVECSSAEDGGSGASCDNFKGLVSDTGVLEGVLNPTVNQVQYHISIKYQRDAHTEMTSGQDQEQGDFNKAIAPYLLPVEIIVRDTRDTAGAKQTVIEGYITDEQIR